MLRSARCNINPDKADDRACNILDTVPLARVIPCLSPTPACIRPSLPPDELKALFKYQHGNSKSNSQIHAWNIAKQHRAAQSTAERQPQQTTGLILQKALNCAPAERSLNRSARLAVCLSVCLSASSNSRTAERIPTTFRQFYENLSSHLNVHFRYDRLT
jgi:hypothetical protein